MDDQRSNFARGKIVAICQAMLNGEIGVLAGSRILDELEFELFRHGPGHISRDEDFLTFVGINSESDHLPIGRERSNWSLEALVRKDVEVSEAEAAYKEAAFEACRKLIDRFNLKRSPQ